MPSNPSTSSLLSTAHSLRSHLVASLSPALSLDSPSDSPAHLHPLSALPPSAIPALRAHLHASLDSLRTGLSAFQSLLPPPPSLDPSPPAPPLPTAALTDKYLTLLREAALARSALLASRSDDRLTSSRLVALRADYEHLYPVLHPAEAATPELVLPILERLAREVGLVCFRDDEGAVAQQEHVTLSLGGKVMVVDFEVGRVQSGGGEGRADAREKEQVSKVKVAYVFDGADSLDERAAAKLQALFDGLRQENEQGREKRWKGVRQLLRELHVLDERTESEGRDCFVLVEQLHDEVERRVKELQAKPEYVPLSVVQPSQLERSPLSPSPCPLVPLCQHPRPDPPAPAPQPSFPLPHPPRLFNPLRAALVRLVGRFPSLLLVHAAGSLGRSYRSPPHDPRGSLAPPLARRLPCERGSRRSGEKTHGI
ncbi:hypothetical protein JCM21900_000201 [Sporobolomyces salmonicolor]